MAMVAMDLLLSLMRASISVVEVRRLALMGELISLLRVLRAENLMTELCSLVKKRSRTEMAYERSLLVSWVSSQKALHASRLTMSEDLWMFFLMYCNRIFSVYASRLVL